MFFYYYATFAPKNTTLMLQFHPKKHKEDAPNGASSLFVYLFALFTPGRHGP